MNDCMIGILAGMGPRSTAPFIDLVVNECQLQYGAKYDGISKNDDIFFTYSIFYGPSHKP